MKIHLLLIICALLFAAGCTIPSQFYLRNDLSKSVTIRLYRPDGGTISNPLTSIEGIVRVRYNLNESFTETINPVRIESAYIDYNIPPMTTTYLGSGANSKKFNFSEVYLLGDDQAELAPLFVIGDEKLIAKKGLVKGYFVYYDLSKILTE